MAGRVGAQKNWRNEVSHWRTVCGVFRLFVVELAFKKSASNRFTVTTSDKNENGMIRMLVKGGEGCC